MNADRELLELAAKAIGLEYDVDNAGSLWYPPAPPDDGKAYAQTRFCPNTDKAQSFQLMVDLRIDVEFYRSNDIEGDSVGAIHSSGITCCYCRENTALNPDIDSATRRAILRAAAEIGKAMP